MAQSPKTSPATELLSDESEQVLEDPPSLDDDFFEDPSLDWEAPDSTTEMPLGYAVKAMRSARLKELKRSLVKRRVRARTEGANWEKPDSTAELPKGYAETILDGMVDVDKVAPGGWEEPDNTAVMAGVHVQRLLDSADEEHHSDDSPHAEDTPLPAPQPQVEPEPEPAPEPEPIAEAPPTPRSEKPLEKPGLDPESVALMLMAGVLLLSVLGLVLYSLVAIVAG